MTYRRRSVAEREAAGAATATLAGLTRSLRPVLAPVADAAPGGWQRRRTRRSNDHADGHVERRHGGSRRAGAARPLQGRGMSVRLREAHGCGNTLEGRGALAWTCSNRVSHLPRYAQAPSP